MKFRYKGEALLEQVQTFNWEFLQDIKVHQFLIFVKENNYKSTVRIYPNVSVTIPIPKHEEDIRCVNVINLLKGVALFPFELESPTSQGWFDNCEKVHVLVQLALSSHFGSPDGAQVLRTIPSQYMKLSCKHLLKRKKHENDWESEYCKFYIGEQVIQQGNNSKINFEKLNNDKFKIVCDNLYQIESTGVLPFSKANFLLDEDNLKEDLGVKKDKLFKIVILGENCENKTLQKYIGRNLTTIKESQQYIEGNLKLRKEILKLRITKTIRTPIEDEKFDGFVITDFQENPEDFANSLKRKYRAKAFIFFATPQPDRVTSNNGVYYVDQKEMASKEYDWVFKDFIERML